MRTVRLLKLPKKLPSDAKGTASRPSDGIIAASNSRETEPEVVKFPKARRNHTPSFFKENANNLPQTFEAAGQVALQPCASMGRDEKSTTDSFHVTTRAETDCSPSRNCQQKSNTSHAGTRPPSRAPASVPGGFGVAHRPFGCPWRSRQEADKPVTNRGHGEFQAHTPPMIGDPSVRRGSQALGLLYEMVHAAYPGWVPSVIGQPVVFDACGTTSTSAPEQVSARMEREGDETHSTIWKLLLGCCGAGVHQ